VTDISKLSSQQISYFAGMYSHAIFSFGVDPMEASEKQQKKICRWIYKKHEGILCHLPDKDDLLRCLKACFDLENKLEKEKADSFDRHAAGLDAASRSALRELMNCAVWPDTKLLGSDLQIVIEDTPAYRRTLTVKNVDAAPLDKAGYFCQNLTLVYKKDQNRYCVCGELEDVIEETVQLFAMTFDAASVEVEVFNACNNVAFWGDPWDYLRTVTFGIGMKADLPGDYCNDREKALLPLIREIAALEYWMELPEQPYFSFDKLKKLTAGFGYQKAEALLTKLETLKPGCDAYHKTTKRLLSILCEKQCEPLWRQIYNDVAASQAEYPSKVDVQCDKTLLADLRRDIQSRMEANGYTGTYPDFVKVGPLKGLHLEHSYNMTYFVGMEKRAQYHIHCSESLEEEGQLTIQFLCGTALLKKDEEEADVYGCLFNAGGKRLFRTVHHDIPLDPDSNTKADDLDTSVTIAVKKAQCIKLNKAEKKEYYGRMIPGWGMFWWTFLIAGGMFGIAMTLIFMIISIIATAAFGLFAEIPDMLKTMPWGLFLAIGWVGFGGAMGIAEVLAHRK